MVNDADDDSGHGCNGDRGGVRALAQPGKLAIRDRLSADPRRLQPLPSPNLPFRRSRPDLSYFAWLVASPCRIGGLVFAHEDLDVVASIGIALVSGGIISLAF